MAEAAAPSNSPVDYGQDSPLLVKNLNGRGIWTFAFGFALWWMNREEYPGPGASMFAALAVVAAGFFGAAWFMKWSSKAGKLQLRDRLLASVDLKGEEKVLDVGCGRGLLAVAIAKKLAKAGRVTAVDLWDQQALSGNSGDAIRDNAKRESVGDKIRVEQGDARKLSYPDSNFDLVVSNGVLHHMTDEPDRDQAVREMYRVTKPGGRILIADTFHAARHAQILRESGAGDVQIASQGFLFCAPYKSVSARK
jgi:SAM-dependent methyltransferase